MDLGWIGEYLGIGMLPEVTGQNLVDVMVKKACAVLRGGKLNER